VASAKQAADHRFRHVSGTDETDGFLDHRAIVVTPSLKFVAKHNQAVPIYVESFIRAPIGAVWEKTQRPELHTAWDLRFSDISYLPRADENEAQRFLY
jgi:hypothetical protein